MIPIFFEKRLIQNRYHKLPKAKGTPIGKLKKSWDKLPDWEGTHDYAKTEMSGGWHKEALTDWREDTTWKWVTDNIELVIEDTFRQRIKVTPSQALSLLLVKSMVDYGFKGRFELWRNLPDNPAFHIHLEQREEKTTRALCYITYVGPAFLLYRNVLLCENPKCLPEMTDAEAVALAMPTLCWIDGDRYEHIWFGSKGFHTEEVPHELHATMKSWGQMIWDSYSESFRAIVRRYLEKGAFQMSGYVLKEESDMMVPFGYAGSDPQFLYWKE